MKTSFFPTIVALLIGITTGTAQKTNDIGNSITVTIENVLNDEGSILASLYTADTFMKGPGIANQQVNAKTGEVTLTFSGVEPGSYSLMVMHDVNDNKRMDYDANGMPLENYATSGAPNQYGPPTFEETKFELNGQDETLRLRF